MPKLNTGDRIWVTPAAEPNALELYISSCLSDRGQIGDFARIAIFNVGPAAFSSSECRSKSLKFEDTFVDFVRITEKIDVHFPSSKLVEKVSEPNVTINILNNKVTFEDQYLCVLSKDAPTGRVDGVDHIDNLDFGMGLSSLLLGLQLGREPLFDGYFDKTKGKFTFSNLQMKTEAPEQRAFFLLDTLPEEPFANVSKIERRALRICARAHQSRDQAIRIIRYYSALEVLFGKKSMQNKVRSFYRFDQGLVEEADRVISKLRESRRKAIHHGLYVEFNESDERRVQAIAMDIVFKDSVDNSKKSLLRAVCEDNPSALIAK